MTEEDKTRQEKYGSHRNYRNHRPRLSSILVTTAAAFLTGSLTGATLWYARALITSVASRNDASFSLRLETAALGAVSLLSLRWCWILFRTTAKSVSYGSAGFAEAHEIRDLMQSRPGGEKRVALSSGKILLGSIIGRPSDAPLVVLPALMARQHGVIVGGSGTGKSWGFFLPNTAFAQKTSCIVTDPKSELWQHTSGFHKSQRFAPTEPDQSSSFNWIPLCKDARIAELCARAIVEAGATERQEPPWPDLEAAFLAALFSHASTLSIPTPLSAYQLFTRQEPAALMETFLSSPSPVAQEQAIIFGQTNERMRGSIVPVVASKLQFLRDPAVARFTSAELTPPDFGRLRRVPESIYWCVREQDIARLRPLSAVFFTLVLEQLAAAPAVPAAPLASKAASLIPVNMFLDEFANLGVIPHFETTISLARGRGVSLWLGIQSLSQLEARYGRANAQTILTNCATKIALCGLDVETAEYFSRSLGQTTGQVPRRTWQRKRFSLFAGSTSDTVQEHARALLTADEVRRIGLDEALVIVSNRRPLLLQKFSYSLPPQAAKATCLGPALATVILPMPPSPPSPSTSKRKSSRLPDDDRHDRRQITSTDSTESDAVSSALPQSTPPTLPEELLLPLVVAAATDEADEAGQSATCPKMPRRSFKPKQKGTVGHVTWVPKPGGDTK